MKKQIFLLALFLISQIGVFSQDPFEKYGYKPRVHTLSNEKYQEFFDNEDVVRIGTALFNTQTNKIVGYVEDDSAMYQNLETELASRWLSLDPMTEEYPSWSPYNYAVNNPIKNYDPNGKWVESFLDIGFILYDIGEIAYDYATTGNVNSVSVAALGADVACLALPVATGGGLAIRAAREGGEQVAKHVASEVVEKGVKTTLEINKAVGKEGEKIVTNALQKEVGEGKQVLNQVTGKFQDGSRTVMDNAVIDKKTGKITMTNETKTGNATYTKQQSRYQNGESVTLTGKNAGAAKGQTISTSTTTSRTSRVDNQTKQIKIDEK